MISVLLYGANGHMGKVVTEMIAQEEGIEIVAGVDAFGGQNADFPVFTSLADCTVPADVINDFSTAKAVDLLLAYGVERHIPMVICTTGLSPEQIQAVEDASKEVAVLRSANMSLGINLLLKLVKEAAATLAPAGFDIEIVERHHNQKKDAPSGTALALADSINEEMDQAYSYVYDRTGRSQKRDPKEIGISAVRGGTIPGTHEVIFAGTDEVIELNHIAYSRSIFGKGALAAAKYLAGKPPKFYSMADVIG